MATKTWAKLADSDVGKTLTFTFPWESKPTTGVLRELTGLKHTVTDFNGVTTTYTRFVIDLPSVGAQPVQLPDSLDVDVQPTKPATATSRPGA